MTNRQSPTLAQGSRLTEKSVREGGASVVPGNPGDLVAPAAAGARGDTGNSLADRSTEANEIPAKSPAAMVPTTVPPEIGATGTSTTSPGITTSPSRPLKVLYVSHMHPRVSRGGAEIAAYQMYETMQTLPDTRALFVGASGGKVLTPLGATVFQPFGPDEYVLGDSGYDHWIHTSHNPRFGKELCELLAELQPDIVHFHHFANIGIEAFLHVRNTLPSARIVVTLHEFLAICNHFGQMVKRPGLALCEAATPRDCAKCFPQRSENDFFLRKMYLMRFFKLVDHFISPSQFLADRFIDWGIPANRISVIENGQPPLDGAPVPMPSPSTLVVGFFGQLSELKGVGVLLDAATELRRRPSKTRPIRIEIHGDASNQPPELRAEVERRLEQNRNVVAFRGAYDNRKVHTLMQGCHAVLVPSIWWENSPLVIQEAFASRRPVICSDIGGMAEKVRHGLDGFHFRAGSGSSLADLLRSLANEPAQLDALAQTLAVPYSLEETTQLTRDLYARVMSRQVSN